MSDSSSRSTKIERIEEIAYDWVQREHAGLSAAETAELQRWLELDVRHAASFADFKKEWDRFGDFVEAVVTENPEPDLRRFGLPDRTKAAPLRAATWRQRVRPIVPYLAAAAVLAIGFLGWRQYARPAGDAPVALSLPVPIEQRTLEDGSVVELNRGAQIAVQFSDTERHVQLLSGEANFQVAKNPNRPFIVEAGGVKVRAVGTAFNVRFDPTSVQVVVTEGKVRVDQPAIPPSGHAPAEAATASFLEAGQKATVPLAVATPVAEVVTLAAPELERELLWQPKLLNFDQAALSEIAAEFNRRNPVHLVVDVKSVGERRITATFRSDNVEGFVRLLESNLGIKAERLNEQEILLTHK